MNSKAPVHPEQFTAEGMKLAILNQKLGELKSDAKRSQLMAEKVAYAKARENKTPYAKDVARLETANERAIYEAIDDQHGDVKRIMDMLRSHASAIKDDR
jgi:hypothetical protein